MKKLLKEILNIAALAMISPLILMQIIASKCIKKGEGLFATFSQGLSLLPGTSGSYLRKSFYRVTMTYCDRECSIGFGTLFSQSDTEIYYNVYIGPQCNIGKCRIERSCLLGSGVHILSGKNQHDFSDIDMSIQQQGGQFDKVSVGEDSWIGNGAIIMANVGKKCVVGAGSVVIKDIPDYAIVAGNPAKIIKFRN